MRNDLLFAVRSLRNNLGLTLTVFLTLALGIGANTAIFSVVYSVLLRSLPYPESDRLVRIYSSNVDKTQRGNSAIPDFLDWQQNTETLDAVEAFRLGFVSLDGNQDLRARIVRGTPGLLELIGARPAHGRLLQGDDLQTDAPPVVLLAYEFWMSRFGGDREAVGRSLQLGDSDYTIIGVADPITGPLLGRVQAFTPWVVQNERAANSRGSRFLPVLGRLATGKTLDQAQAELDVLGARVRREFPETSDELYPLVVSLYEETVERVRPSLMVLIGATGLILLIAIANIANLFLARGEGRRSELAVRSALGASQRRITRLLLTESLLLSVLGGLAGIALGYGLIQLLLTSSPTWIPRLQEIGIDWTVLTIALVGTLGCGLIFGSAPIFSLRRASVLERIQVTKGQGGEDRPWARSGLVVVQLALSLVLLTGSGLMIPSFLALRSVPVGVDYEQIITFNTGGMGVGNFSNRPARLQQYREVLENLKAIPGVTEATLTSQAPLSGGWGSMTFEILSGQRQGQKAAFDLVGVEPDFFDFFDSSVLEGRLFQPGDSAIAGQVVVIDANLADSTWPDERAVGQRVKLGDNEMEVIGVVEPIRYGDLAREMRPKAYNLADSPYGAFGGTFLIRHEGDPEPILPVVERRFKQVAPSLRLNNLQTLEAVYDRWLRQPRFYLAILGSLGLLALVVAAVGVYGVIAYSVGRRTSEIGIRMALGARQSQIVQLVCRSTLAFLGIGLTLGFLGSLWLTRYLQSFLFEIKPTDPVAMASMAALLATAAMVATLIPARRALRVDPAATLRSE